MQTLVLFFLDNERNNVNGNGKDVKKQKCEFKMPEHDYLKLNFDRYLVSTVIYSFHAIMHILASSTSDLTMTPRFHNVSDAPDPADLRRKLLTVRKL